MKNSFSENDISPSTAELAKKNKEYKGRYSGPDSAYELAYLDKDFMTSHEMRGVRMQTEITKPDVVFEKHGIKHTITVFGSARLCSKEQAEKMLSEAKTPEEVKEAELALKRSVHYEKAYQFGRLIGERNRGLPMDEQIIIATGGGPSVMEAANRGALEAGSLTAGFNITLPFEQEPNPYITPSLCFQFSYFSSRKFSLLASGSSTYGKPLVQGKGFQAPELGGGGSIAITAFAGGYGTLDEIFEVACLCQVGKMRPRPIILVGKDFWNELLNLKFLSEEGVISPEDLSIISIVDTPEEAWQIIRDFYAI